MNAIYIEYKGKRRHYRAPGEWNELTRRQLFEWCGIVRQAVPLDEAMDAAVMLLYDIPVDLLGRLNLAQRLQLAQSLEFLQDGNKLTANVIGRLWVLGRSYRGPAGRLANLTIGEYRRTELYYQLWLKNGDKQLLQLLAATLFRPKGKGRPDDVREGLNETRINRRAGLFRLLHPNWIHAVLLYYEGCRAAIRGQYPRVYVKAAAGGEKKGAAKEIAWKLVDLDEYILAYSGDKLGTYAETMQVNVHVFFKHMTQRLEEYDRLKQERATK